jgi:hypothetical protein
MIDEPRDATPENDAPADPFGHLRSAVEGLELDGSVEGPELDTPAPAGPDLNAQLRGYTPPAPGVEDHKREQRLCIGCNKVTEFVDDRCLNCGYRLGSSTPGGAEAAFTVGEAYGAPAGGGLKWAVAVIAILVIAAVGWFVVWPMLSADDRVATDAKTTVPEAGETPAEGEADAGFVGGLKPVEFNDDFKLRVTTALRAANDAWSKAGTDAYVYRYNLYEKTVPATSQEVAITGFVHGADAAQAITDDGSKLFRAAMDGLLASLNDQPGVEARLALETNPEFELPSPNDVYVVYGYAYGRENWEQIEEVIDAIEGYKQAYGQYPIALDSSVKNDLRTKGNPTFSASGFGYIPVFRTDGSGNIVMGSGGGMASLNPAEITGYYLLAFTRDPGEGLDFYSPADIDYYTQKISPFPYSPRERIRNMPLRPDGKADGIAAIIKNGELQGQ